MSEALAPSSSSLPASSACSLLYFLATVFLLLLHVLLLHHHHHHTPDEPSSTITTHATSASHLLGRVTAPYLASLSSATVCHAAARSHVATSLGCLRLIHDLAYRLSILFRPLVPRPARSQRSTARSDSRFSLFCFALQWPVDRRTKLPFSNTASRSGSEPSRPAASFQHTSPWPVHPECPSSLFRPCFLYHNCHYFLLSLVFRPYPTYIRDPRIATIRLAFQPPASGSKYACRSAHYASWRGGQKRLPC